MILVISSPSRSTTGFFTAIFLALRAVAVLAKLRVCAFATEDSADTGRIDRLASRIAAPVALELTMLRAERGTGHVSVIWVVSEGTLLRLLLYQQSVEPGKQNVRVCAKKMEERCKQFFDFSFFPGIEMVEW